MINPILASSALRRMRSAKTLLILGVYVLVLLLIVLAMLSPFLRENQVTVDNFQMGLITYIVLMLAQFFLIVLVTPAMTAGSIAGERERQTLELLLVTNTGSYAIVLGKWMESFAFIALLILCGLPVTALTMLPGGVGLMSMLLGTLFLLVCAFAASAVGVLCSSFMKNTVGATVISYIVLLFIGVGTLLPLFFGITPAMAGRLYDTAKYAAMTPLDAVKMMPKPLFLNPGVGLVALVEDQVAAVQSTFASSTGRLYALFLIMKKIGYGRVALINMGGMVLLAVAFSGIAALLVRPRKVRVRKRK